MEAGRAVGAVWRRVKTQGQNARILQQDDPLAMREGERMESNFHISRSGDQMNGGGNYLGEEHSRAVDLKKLVEMTVATK